MTLKHHKKVLIILMVCGWQTRTCNSFDLSSMHWQKIAETIKKKGCWKGNVPLFFVLFQAINQLSFTFSRCFYPKRLTNDDNRSTQNIYIYIYIYINTHWPLY